MVAREGLAAAAAPDELRVVAGAPADPQGEICPHVAHIRKVNPRDLSTDQGDAADTRSFQMLRRGITWGEPYAEDEPPAAADRGLLFMSYQTSIVQQFELLTQKWMNRTGAPEGVAGHDLLVGQSADGIRSAALPGGGTISAPADERWVIPTGGGYFFTPSRSGLAALADGH
jgi:deferrochelatase/peroxidase EfeB